MNHHHTLHNIAMTQCREIADGLYCGRDNQGHLRIFDREHFRGYASPWSTPAIPKGWQVQVWSKGFTLRSDKRTLKTQRGADRRLEREAIRLHSVEA